MSSVPLREWLRTAFLALVTALLLDYVVTTTPPSYAAAPPAAPTSATATTAATPASEVRGRDPRRTRKLFVDRLMPAAQAGRTDRANRAGRTPMVALYAIPGRDYGRHSSGGFTARVDRQWVRQVVRGLRGQHAIAVVEPDARCGCGRSSPARPTARATAARPPGVVARGCAQAPRPLTGDVSGRSPAASSRARPAP